MSAYNSGLLKRILSQPTAPYREKQVVDTIIEELEASKVPYFRDPIGNIVLGVGSAVEYRKRLAKKSKEPLRVFIAHMDHPGFHGVSWLGPKLLKVTWLGGSPRTFLNGARVWLADDSGIVGKGVLTKTKLNAMQSAMKEGTVKLKEEISQRDAKSLFGSFQFRAPVWEKNHVLYTKAADDLVGAFTIVSLAKEKRNENFIGLLTRAEEVGFIGAIGHFDLGWLGKAKRSVLCISLETSRTLPGALVGRGPVVRLGDRATTFDPGMLEVLTQVAKRELPGKFQRRIMDGGTCEATAATAFGFTSIGISIPLGNYHNQSFEGGPDSRGPLGPAPEFVHTKDIEGMLTLCKGLMKSGLPWKEPWGARREEFRKAKKAAKRLLQYS